MARFNANLLDDDCLYVFYSKKHNEFIDLDGFSGMASYCPFHDDITIATPKYDVVNRLWKNIFDSFEKAHTKSGSSMLYIENVDLIPLIDGCPEFTGAVNLHTLIGQGSII